MNRAKTRNSNYSRILKDIKKINWNGDTLLDLRRIVIKILRLYIIIPIIKKYFGPYLVVFLLHFRPESISLLNKIVSKIESMSFISPDDKPFKTDNLLDDFTIDVVNTNSFDEINCIIRGSSVSNNFGKINTKIPTFIIDENFVIDKFEEIIYITGDMKKFSRMKNKGLLPLIFVGSNGFLSKYVSNNSSKKVLSDSAAMPSMFVKFNAKNNSRPSMGSALMSVLALSKISNKINVYGWDLHLEKNISEMNYFEYIKFLLHTTSDRFGRKRDIRIQSVFEKIINLNYIYRMQLDSKFNIVSYASSIVDRKSLITNIQRAIYK